MSVNLFDLIATLLILLLALKGALNGLQRELFAFAGLIGGVFLASRGAAPLARWVEAHLVHLPNPALTRLIAFVLILSLVWGGLSWLGRWVHLRFPGGAHGTLARVGGFVIAGVKYFLIFAMILAALYRTPSLRHKLQPLTRGSLLAPILLESGRSLIHLAPLRRH
jgi:membrane protein required for colicin V production